MTTVWQSEMWSEMSVRVQTRIPRVISRLVCAAVAAAAAILTAEIANLMLRRKLTSRTSLPPRRSMPRHRFSLRPCTVPPSCSLQPLLKLSLLSLRPFLLQFVSIASLLLNHGNRSFEPVCVFNLFLFCLYFADINELQL